MPSYEQIQIIGHVGGDAELKTLPSGATVCEFSVACGRGYFDRQSSQWVEQETAWYKVSVWNEAGQRLVDRVKKGAAVFVVGVPNNSVYIGNDGQPKLDAGVKAFTVKVLTKTESRHDEYSPSEDDHPF